MRIPSLPVNRNTISFWPLMTPIVPRWKWVDYRDFINIYMFGSGSSLPPRGFLNGSLLLREFLMNIEDELGASMNDQDFEFVQENYPSFVDAVALRYQRRRTGREYRSSLRKSEGGVEGWRQEGRKGPIGREGPESRKNLYHGD